MPYKTNQELPDSVKDNLPGEAQTVFRDVFNESEDKGEEAAFRIAWTAVKNGWKQNEDGEWVRKAEGDASTPAPASERRRGSDRNPAGSAASGRGGIEIGAETNTALRNKVTDHNEAHGDKSGKRVTLGQLKAVYRRGAGAYSTSHRPGMTRNQWAMARVNAFLELVRTGKPGNSAYVTDNDLLPAGHPKRTKKIAKAHTGLWMGLWVPDELAEKMELPVDQVPEREPAENLHLTVAYFGDLETIDEDTLEAVLKVAEVFAAGSDPVIGKVSGMGRFVSEEENGKDVIYLSVDSPDLPDFHHALVTTMEHVGLELDDTHGFTPHITLAYVEPGTGDLSGIRPQPVPIQFSELWVGVGDEYYVFPLGEDVRKAEVKTNFPSSGDNQKISLSNSNFPQFPYEYAANIKETYPQVWRKGGNEFGNQAFLLWGRARKGEDSTAIQNWIKRRERFMNRHQNDFQLAGVVAVMKWGGIVNKGLPHMKSVIGEARDKVEKTEFRVAKVDEERRLVFGWANISMRRDGKLLLDHQLDMISPDDLEMGAYGFVLDFRETGEMHEGTSKGRLIESFVATPEKLQRMGLEPDALPIGWWVGFYIEDDDAWSKVKDGTYRMWSVEGSAIREEVKEGA